MAKEERSTELSDITTIAHRHHPPNQKKNRIISREKTVLRTYLGIHIHIPRKTNQFYLPLFPFPFNSIHFSSTTHLSHPRSLKPTNPLPILVYQARPQIIIIILLVLLSRQKPPLSLNHPVARAVVVLVQFLPQK